MLLIRLLWIRADSDVNFGWLIYSVSIHSTNNRAYMPRSYHCGSY